MIVRLNLMLRKSMELVIVLIHLSTFYQIGFFGVYSPVTEEKPFKKAKG